MWWKLWDAQAETPLLCITTVFVLVHPETYGYCSLSSVWYLTIIATRVSSILLDIFQKALKDKRETNHDDAWKPNTPWALFYSHINPKMNLCSTGTCLRLPLGVSQPFVGTVEKFVSLPAALLERITYIFQSTVEVWSWYACKWEGEKTVEKTFHVTWSDSISVLIPRKKKCMRCLNVFQHWSILKRTLYC